MRRRGFTALAVIGLTLAISSSALADETFYLTVPENSCATTSPPCIPAGTVLVDVDLLTSSTATVKFTGQTVGGNLYALDEVLFQLNGGSVSSYTVTGGSASGTFGAPGGGSIDLYGTFNVESEDMHNASSVVFNLTGGSWTSSDGGLLNNVLTTTPLANNNAGGYAQPFDAAAEVRVADCSSSLQPGCNGQRGTDTGDNDQKGEIGDTAGFVSAVPEPTSVLLFGSVLLLVGLVGRKRLAR